MVHESRGDLLLLLLVMSSFSSFRAKQEEVKIASIGNCSLKSLPLLLDLHFQLKHSFLLCFQFPVDVYVSFWLKNLNSWLFSVHSLVSIIYCLGFFERWGISLMRNAYNRNPRFRLRKKPNAYINYCIWIGVSKILLLKYSNERRFFYLMVSPQIYLSIK